MDAALGLTPAGSNPDIQFHTISETAGWALPFEGFHSAFRPPQEGPPGSRVRVNWNFSMYLFLSLEFAVARCQESKLTMETVPAGPVSPNADSVDRAASQSEMRL